MIDLAAICAQIDAVTAEYDAATDQEEAGRLLRKRAALRAHLDTAHTQNCVADGTTNRIPR